MLGLRQDERLCALLLQPDDGKLAEPVCRFCRDTWEQQCYTLTKNGRVMVALRLTISEVGKNSVIELAGGLLSALETAFPGASVPPGHRALLPGSHRFQQELFRGLQRPQLQPAGPFPEADLPFRRSGRLPDPVRLQKPGGAVPPVSGHGGHHLRIRPEKSDRVSEHHPHLFQSELLDQQYGRKSCSSITIRSSTGSIRSRPCSASTSTTRRNASICMSALRVADSQGPVEDVLSERENAETIGPPLPFRGGGLPLGRKRRARRGSLQTVQKRNTIWKPFPPRAVVC